MFKNAKNSHGGRKREPISHGVNVVHASQIGAAQGNHASDGGGTMRTRSEPMYQGRGGIVAPKSAMTVHHRGSQGKHK